MAQARHTDTHDASLIREIVGTQLRSLAWTRDEDPNWVAFAQGFLPNARLFPAARPVRPQTIDQFMDRMKGLRAEGKLASFRETPLGCAVRVFGNVAVAFAACEMLENGSTVTRDVSAIVLVRDTGTWRIVAQAWDVETESNRIPGDLAEPAHPLLATRVPKMGVQLDHAIVPARDRKAAAELLATLLGVPWAESGAGPFCPVYVNEGLTLDFDQAEGPFPVQHYCFRVSEAEFDGIVTRIRARGIDYRSTPHGPVDMQVNTQHGGRIVYWNEPDGHVWEALTVSYARRPQITA